MNVGWRTPNSILQSVLAPSTRGHFDFFRPSPSRAAPWTGFYFVAGLDPQLSTKRTRPMKPFNGPTKPPGNKPVLSSPQDQKMGCDHVDPRSQRDLPPLPSGRPFRHFEPGSKAMTEVVTALAVIFSMSIFLAHAFDGYRMR